MVASEPADRWRRLAPWTSPDNLAGWLERTTWWTRALGMSEQQMLVDLLEATAGRFLGREVTLEVRDRSVRLTLRQIRVEGGGARARDPLSWLKNLATTADRVRVLVESSDVTLDDHPVGDLTATVADVRLEYGAPVELVTGAIDVDVHTTTADVVAWIGRAWPEWTVRLHGSDLVAVRHRDWRGMLVMRPRTVEEHQVTVDVVGVVVLGRVVLLPRRFVRQRTIELPDPSEELTLVGARVDNGDVIVHLRHVGLRQVVRVEHLRTAIREGVASLGAKVFA